MTFHTIKIADRHPGTIQLMAHFRYSHLPAGLQALSQPFADLAAELVDRLDDSPELTTALRKLLEAKDCAVRCGVPPMMMNPDGTIAS